ncbi:hypothetical protein LCGC14_1815040 [marine sediment metagenome]|uniref:Uncharacterized protein n=1 Tax=marine sediment metagenome TaxID=412755 RepID=A0A0F9JK85_9ZZZZ
MLLASKRFLLFNTVPTATVTDIQEISLKPLHGRSVEYVGSGETDYFDPVLDSQGSITHEVLSFGRLMDPTINLDNHLKVWAVEIDDIGGKNVLLAEVETARMLLQESPHLLLDGSRTGPHLMSSIL